MKISKKVFGISVISVIIILLETISIAAVYNSAVLGEKYIKKENIQIEIQQEEVNLSEEEREVLDLINQYRKQNNLKELKTFSRLQKVAKIKAEDLVNNNYFSHNSNKLGTPFEMLENNGIDYKIAGENLAGNITAKKAVEAWINSPSHRDNILEENFEYTGIYVIESPVYGKIYVQLFIGI